MAKSLSDMVAEAKARIENVSVQDAAREVEDAGAMLVDVREPDERTTNGAIAGAVSAPRGMLELYADPDSPAHREEFDRDRRIILHCGNGGRSALATATLQEMGYTKVANMDGGFKAWKEAGRAVEGG